LIIISIQLTSLNTLFYLALTVQLASLCLTSRSNIACWENGSRFPNYDNLITLALQLNIDLDYLCGLNNNLKYDLSSLKPSTISKIDELIKKDLMNKI
jgi:transcriptional regulator with XRE-family HTH domain